MTDSPSRWVIKKSELYSPFRASCDELRGGMDASQYEDLCTVEMLFIKHVSDEYAAVPGLVAKWESAPKVEVGRVFVQRMQTKWGGCNPASARSTSMPTLPSSRRSASKSPLTPTAPAFSMAACRPGSENRLPE